MAGIGVPPKPASKRRRRNVPRTYGAAEPITAPAGVQDRELGIDTPHQLVADMWKVVIVGREQVLLRGRLGALAYGAVERRSGAAQRQADLRQHVGWDPGTA